MSTTFAFERCPAAFSMNPSMSSKAALSGVRRLRHFDQLALVAVSSEPARPLKINLDRAPRKMASPPQLDDRPFAVITKSHIHAILDVQIRPDAQALGKLIKRSCRSNPPLTDLRKLVSG